MVQHCVNQGSIAKSMNSYTYIFKKDYDASDGERAVGHLCSGSQIIKENRLALTVLIMSD